MRTASSTPSRASVSARSAARVCGSSSSRTRCTRRRAVSVLPTALAPSIAMAGTSGKTLSRRSSKALRKYFTSPTIQNAGFLLVKTHDFYQSKRRTVAGRDERWRSSSAASSRILPWEAARSSARRSSPSSSAIVACVVASRHSASTSGQVCGRWLFPNAKDRPWTPAGAGSGTGHVDAQGSTGHTGQWAGSATSVPGVVATGVIDAGSNEYVNDNRQETRLRMAVSLGLTIRGGTAKWLVPRCV